MTICRTKATAIVSSPSSGEPYDTAVRSYIEKLYKYKNLRTDYYVAFACAEKGNSEALAFLATHYLEKVDGTYFLENPWGALNAPDITENYRIVYVEYNRRLSVWESNNLIRKAEFMDAYIDTLKAFNELSAAADAKGKGTTLVRPPFDK